MTLRDQIQQAARRRVDVEGLRPLAASTGIPLGSLRSLLAGRAVRITSLESIAAALGYELSIRPRSAPVRLAAASQKGGEIGPISPPFLSDEAAAAPPDPPPESPPAPPGVTVETVPDREIAEVVAALVDEYEALNERGQESLLARFWGLHPDLRERARTHAGRRLARLAGY